MSGELERLSQAEKMLASIETPQDAIHVKDIAAAFRTWGKRRQVGRERLNAATSLQARAYKAMAELVDEGQRRGEIATQKDTLIPVVAQRDNRPAPTLLRDLGTDRRELHKAREIAELTWDEILGTVEEWDERDKEITCKDLQRMVRRRRRSERAAVIAEHPSTIELEDAVTWLKRQEPCDLLITDPPYATDVEDVAAFAGSWLPLALGKVKSSGRAFVFIGAYPDELRAYLPLLKRDGWGEQVLAWYYPDTLGPSPTHAFKSVWQAILYTWGPDAPRLAGETLTERTTLQQFNMNSGIDGGRDHQWQKPDRLADRLITLASSEGDSILDPFAGTGTFLLSSSRLGRFAKGCEVDPTMLEIAVRRGCLHE